MTVKNLLAKSAASSGEPDAHWGEESVSRLYFFDPNNQETSGSVDVVNSEVDGANARVRVELWLEPTKAAAIIAMVTGSAAAPIAKRAKRAAAKSAPTPRSIELAALISAQKEDAQKTDRRVAKRPVVEEDPEELDGLPPEVDFPES